jgi:hypothetical protein
MSNPSWAWQDLVVGGGSLSLFSQSLTVPCRRYGFSFWNCSRFWHRLTSSYNCLSRRLRISMSPITCNDFQLPNDWVLRREYGNGLRSQIESREQADKESFGSRMTGSEIAQRAIWVFDSTKMDPRNIGSYFLGMIEAKTVFVEVP